jgi:hypothetical protein
VTPAENAKAEKRNTKIEKQKQKTENRKELLLFAVQEAGEESLEFVGFGGQP